MALAKVHRHLAVGACVDIVASARWTPEELRYVLTGAGFHTERIEPHPQRTRGQVARVTRLRTLPDFVGPGMRLLVCGLNPSEYSADAGVGFARPGNRFWPAALAAGLVTVARDPWHALAEDGVGFTDLVKRATPNANVLTAEEYRTGLDRVEWLTRWLRPQAVCFVGLAGWRAAVDRRAVAGVVGAADVLGVPTYLMPSTSGRNASSRPATLVAHLRAAASLADRERVVTQYGSKGVE
jgi:TDG/mug DNA glycosylase family protein